MHSPCIQEDSASESSCMAAGNVRTGRPIDRSRTCGHNVSSYIPLHMYTHGQRTRTETTTHCAHVSNHQLFQPARTDQKLGVDSLYASHGVGVRSVVTACQCWRDAATSIATLARLARSCLGHHFGYTECWPAHAAALAQHTAGGLSRASISCLRVRVRANAMPYCHCRS